MRMAAERAEHGAGAGTGAGAGADAVAAPALQGFGGDSDYRVLHGVDVLGHCAKRGVGERLGNHVNQGFGGAPPPRRFVVAGVDGSDAYRAEAEPFTAKRSGTG